MASNARAERRRQERQAVNYTHEPVVLSTLSPGSMSSHCAESIAATILDDGHRPLEDQLFCRPGGGTIMVTSGPRVAETRSKIVDTFLHADHFQTAGWLLMVDSDMVFRPDDVRVLIDHADRLERPIIGGLCFAGITPESMYPTVYSLGRDENSGQFDVDKVMDYPKNALVKVAATGAAFLLVHKQVFMRMGRPHPEGFGTMPDGTPNVYPWFAEGHVDKHGRPFGEDISFCIRAGALGIPVHVHTGAQIGHHKSVILTEELYDRRA